MNEYIRVPEVRVVGDGIEATVMQTAKALQLAFDKGLDLIEISPNAKPPVCKIADYKKFLYEQRKREKEIKSKAAKTVIKEIRFGPNTDIHDFEFKMRHAEKFLKEGAKVKAYVHFRGRSILFKDRGEILLLKFADRLSDLGTLESMPRLEGKRMNIMIASKAKPPKKGVKNKEKTGDKDKAKKSEDGKTAAAEEGATDEVKAVDAKKPVKDAPTPETEAKTESPVKAETSSEEVEKTDVKTEKK